MRTLLAVLVIALASPLVGPGCQTPPSARSNEVSSLKVVGAAVDSSMRIAAELLRDGKITREQWDRVALFHDGMFLPAYHTAVLAVQSDLSSVASPDMMALVGQLAAMIASFQQPPSPPSPVHSP